jgi:hypothetical protein
MAIEKDTTGDANTPPPKVQYIDITWWNAWTQGRQPHEFLIGHIRDLRAKQATRYTNMRKMISIYEWGFKASTYDSVDEQPLSEYTMAWKAASHVVDTVHAKVFKNKLVPMPITSGAGALQRKRAVDLGKALDGLYEENSIDMLEEDAGFDALICGVGFIKTFTEFGRAKACFVPAEDITMDDAEGRYRAPRSIFETKRMDRFQALEVYGGDEDWLSGDREERRRRILACKEVSIGGSLSQGSNYFGNRDQIEIHEAYHLPSSPDAGDGRMCVVIDNCTLVDTEWRRPRFRYHQMNPQPRRRNSWGLSMMHDLAAPQQEYEWVTRGIQKANHKMGGSHFLAHEDANVTERDIDNDKGTLTTWRGNIPPTEWNPTPVNPQTYQYQASLPETMLSSRGISSLSAKGEIPAGLQQASGKALQVFDDIEAEGLRPYHAARQRLHKSLAQGFIDEIRDIIDGEDASSYDVRYTGGRKTIEMVDWKKVILDEEEFVLTVPTINALSQTPSARFEQLQERLNAGLITPEAFKRLDGNPDIQSENEMDTADEDIIMRNLDIMVTEGRYLAPQPFDNLPLYVKLGGKFYNLERAKGTPDNRLELIRNAIADAQALLQPPIPQGPPGGVAPTAPPAPPMPPAAAPPPQGPMSPPMAA